MAVVVSLIVVSALIVLLADIAYVIQKSVRWLTRTPKARTTRPTRRPGPPPSGQFSGRLPYGYLPSLADPVGALGSISPDADLSSQSMDEYDLLGE